MIFVMKFEAAAMSRADVPEEYRRDFCLYVDEFQNFSTDSFADILSQARKYHLNLIVANQFTTQLSEEIRDAVFGNVGSVVTFRVGTTDAEFLAKQFAPVFDIDDLQFLPNYNTAVRMMIGGVPVQPFSMATLPPLGDPNPQLADALKQLSAAKYGRPKAQVDSEISKRLATQAPVRPGFGSGGLNGPSLGGPSLPPAFGSNSAFSPPPGRPISPSANPASPKTAPTSSPSFLDEWLAKRKPNASTRHTTSANENTVVATTGVDQSLPPKTASTIEATSLSPTPLAPSPPQLHGELKIRQNPTPTTNPPAKLPDDADVLHIDKEGNLSYDQ